MNHANPKALGHAYAGWLAVVTLLFCTPHVESQTPSNEGVVTWGNTGRDGIYFFEHLVDGTVLAGGLAAGGIAPNDGAMNYPGLALIQPDSHVVWQRAYKEYAFHTAIGATPVGEEYFAAAFTGKVDYRNNATSTVLVLLDANGDIIREISRHADATAATQQQSLWHIGTDLLLHVHRHGRNLEFLALNLDGEILWKSLNEDVRLTAAQWIGPGKFALMLSEISTSGGDKSHQSLLINTDTGTPIVDQTFDISDQIVSVRHFALNNDGRPVAGLAYIDGPSGKRKDRETVIFRLGIDGKVIWHKKSPIVGAHSFSDLALVGEHLAIGGAHMNQALLMVLNNRGDELWRRRFAINLAENSIARLKSAGDNQVLFAGVSTNGIFGWGGGSPDVWLGILPLQSSEFDGYAACLADTESLNSLKEWFKNSSDIHLMLQPLSFGPGGPLPSGEFIKSNQACNQPNEHSYVDFLEALKNSLESAGIEKTHNGHTALTVGGFGDIISVERRQRVSPLPSVLADYRYPLEAFNYLRENSLPYVDLYKRVFEFKDRTGLHINFMNLSSGTAPMTQAQQWQTLEKIVRQYDKLSPEELDRLSDSIKTIVSSAYGDSVRVSVRAKDYETKRRGRSITISVDKLDELFSFMMSETAQP